jgi:hypothetical protein
MDVDMNEARRRSVTRATTLLNEARELLGICAVEEREYFENMPEGLQSGEKGEAAEAAADILDEAIEELDGAIEKIGEAL